MSPHPQFILDPLTPPPSPTQAYTITSDNSPTHLPHQTWFTASPRETHARHVDSDPRAFPHYVYPASLPSLSTHPPYLSTQVTVIVEVTSVITTVDNNPAAVTNIACTTAVEATDDTPAITK